MLHHDEEVFDAPALADAEPGSERCTLSSWDRLWAEHREHILKIIAKDRAALALLPTDSPQAARLRERLRWLITHQLKAPTQQTPERN